MPVDSEGPTPLAPSINIKDKKPASPASKAPRMGITIPSNDVFETPNIGGESPIADYPSPGAMSTGQRLYSNPKSSNQSRENSAVKFGIKLHQVEKQESAEHKQESTEHVPNKEKRNVSKKAQASATHDEENKSTIQRPKKIVPEPLPLLPKVTTVFSMPPKCPMESIRFIQLKRFQVFAKQLAEHMNPGFDLVGIRRKMIQMRTEERVNLAQAKGKEFEQIAKMDDSTHYIRSIVYAKDPSIIDAEQQHTHQRTAFGHLNNLDVKNLIKKKELFGEEKGGFSSISPRAINRRFNQPKEPILDPQVYKLTGEDDKTLVFESRFESGNLYLAQKVSEAEYNLLMSNDVNTQGHTQWFFFQVKNTRKKSKIRFNLLNYSKADSLFNYGMKVSVYSEKKADKHNIGWHKGGDDIRYFQNGIRKDITYYSKSFYTATFQYTFEYDMDTVYFAYSIPYTYSDLRNDLASIETDPGRSQHVQKKTLCKTLSGEDCEILTITSRDNLENFAQRKGVVLTARVHPGETVGSWMMRGVLIFLTDPNNYEAKLLRENFVFKVIPMLNPDGVINGNYRCSLAGCDLNRRWKSPSKVLHPTIYHTKKLIKQIHQERQCVLFCDIHGHSRKQNVFMYGCNNKQNPGETRIFPFILSKMNDYFCYEYSRFGNQKSKEATARISMYKELKSVPNIFTMESSFAGCDAGPAAGKHFTTEMLETLGHDCCRALLIYCNLYVPPELADLPYFKGIIARKKAAAEAAQANKKTFKEDVPSFNDAIMKEFKNNSALLAQASDSSSGSESAPSEDNMQAEELVKQLPVVDTTLKKQIKKNQELKKKEENNNNNNIQSQVKLRRKSSGENLKRQQTNIIRNPSPIKRPQPSSPEKIVPEKPEEEKKKKPKVETRDACTQTDRSDYQLIKAKMVREQQLKAQYNQTGSMKAQETPSDRNKSDRKRSYPPNKPRQALQYQGQGQPLSQVSNPAVMPGSIHIHPPAGLTQNQTSPKAINSVLSNMQVAQSDGNTEPNQKLMPSQAKYSFMGVSSVKHANGNTNNTTGSLQGAASLSQSQQPNSNFQTEHPLNDGLRPGYGTELNSNPMQKSGFSEKTGHTKDNFGRDRISSDNNTGIRYHSSIHDAPQGLSPARKAPVSVSNAQSMMINQAERAEQELKMMQQNMQRNASRIEETLRINQHASKMEIDQNAMRGKNTGNPNFKIDCTSIGGKPQLPTVTSLSSGYDSSNMSPIQKAGHTVSGGNPNTQNSSLVISQGGSNGVGVYKGSSKIGSATSNYATLQLNQENIEHGRLGMFSPHAQTVKNQKAMHQLPQASKTDSHSIHQQQLAINLDPNNNPRNVSATNKDKHIAQIVGQVGRPNYQIGSVSGFNQQNPAINNAQAQGRNNVSGRRLVQQPEPSMVILNNCGQTNNNFGSLMTSPDMLKGQNSTQGQFAPITEQTQQKRHGGGGATNQPLRASLSKNKSGGWPPNTNTQAPQGYVQPQLGHNANLIQVGGQSPITMTGLTQYRHQQQVAVISQRNFHQNHEHNKLPALNTRSYHKPVQKGGIDWPGGSSQIGVSSPSQHLQVQQNLDNGILASNMIVTSGDQLQNINHNNPHGTSQAPSSYQVAAHQKYMSGTILQVTSAASAPGKNGGPQQNPASIGKTNSPHKVSHSGSCHQPYPTSKPANSTSSANHQRNQGTIFSMGVQGVDLSSKPAQKTTGARTPSNSNIIRDGQVHNERNLSLSVEGQSSIPYPITERHDENSESPVNQVQLNRPFRQFSKEGSLLQSKDAPPVKKSESNQ